MDIVHCYDAINQFNAWYPKYQKRCLNRARQLPTVTALRLPYIEKAKEIFQDELKKMINKGLTKLETINNIFWHYYGMNAGPLRVMESGDLAQKLAEQLVSDSVDRDGIDDKQEEELPPFTVDQIQQVLQSAQNPSKPDPEPEEEEIGLKRSHFSMEVKSAVKNDGGSENQKAYMDRMQESGIKDSRTNARRY